MKIYVVMVRSAFGGSDGARYTDSLWVVNEHAEDRMRDLRAEFERRGLRVTPDIGAWWAWVTEATVTDGQLMDSQAEADDHE